KEEVTGGGGGYGSEPEAEFLDRGQRLRPGDGGQARGGHPVAGGEDNRGVRTVGPPPADHPGVAGGGEQSGVERMHAGYRAAGVRAGARNRPGGPPGTPPVVPDTGHYAPFPLFGVGERRVEQSGPPLPMELE